MLMSSRLGGYIDRVVLLGGRSLKLRMHRLLRRMHLLLLVGGLLLVLGGARGSVISLSASIARPLNIDEDESRGESDHGEEAK